MAEGFKWLSGVGVKRSFSAIYFPEITLALTPIQLAGSS